MIKGRRPELVWTPLLITVVFFGISTLIGGPMAERVVGALAFGAVWLVSTYVALRRSERTK